MKSVEVAAKGGKKTTIQLHDAVTILKVGGAVRDDIADALARVVGSSLVVRAGDVPMAAPAPDTTAPSGDGSTSGEAPVAEVTDPVVDAEAAVAVAEAAVADARSSLVQAETAYNSARDELLKTNRSIDREAGDAVAAAEARLEVAQAGAAAARRALVQARESNEHDAREQAQRTAAEQEEIEALRAEKANLDTDRSRLVARLGEVGPRPEPARIEEALAGLRRLRQVKPRPSDRAVALADRWRAVLDRLGSLPAPPAPPEWLVTPALAALQDAREDLARAEAVPDQQPDPTKVEAVERAHGDVLEAEQRVMRKGSRANRKRLEQTQEIERTALSALGVSSYGEYLQRISPDVDGGQTPEERIAQARAALADAEAVWEELHGGQASPEYTEAKQEQAEIRNEAISVLGETVDDDVLEDRLRNHVETVVDTEWAEQQLTEALREQGVDLAEEETLEAIADSWLASLPQKRDEYDEVDRLLGRVDARIRDIDAILAERQADAFFGSDTVGEAEARPPEERAGGISPADPFAELSAALQEAEEAEKEAAAALDTARRRVEEAATAQSAASAKEKEADAARTAVDAARSRLEEAEASLAAARSASAEAASAAREASAANEKAKAGAARPAASGPDAGAGSPRGVATEAWLLARVAAARVSDADKPFVVDARAIPAKRGLRLLERASAGRQVVVLGDEDEITAWAKGLGQRASIRSI